MSTKSFNKEALQFIRQNLKADLHQLALKYDAIGGYPIKDLIQQILFLRLAPAKWGPFFSDQLVGPGKVSLEQSSSAVTALYKSDLVAGHTLVDITGGSGIDSLAFSYRFDEVTYVEKDSRLCDVLRLNLSVWNRKNIRISELMAEDFLKKQPVVDVVYADPSRRDSSGSRVFSINECSPNMSELSPTIVKAGTQLMIKFSPLLDIKQAVKDLFQVSAVYVVSVANEVKELLFILDHQPTEQPIIHAVDLPQTVENTEPIVPLHQFSFTMEEENHCTSRYSHPLTYVYEPMPSILKAGAFKSVGEKFGLHKISQHAHIYTSEKLLREFPGRVFLYQGTLPTKKKELYKVLQPPHASVFTRDYPLKADVLKKKLGLGEDENRFVVGTTLFNGKKVLLHLSRINPALA